MNEYTINVRHVSDRRLEYVWTPTPFPAAPNALWVEYPFEVGRIEPTDVFYPVLPVFLALSFTNCTFRLVSETSGTNSQDPVLHQVLANWLTMVEAEAVVNFGVKIRAEASVNGQTVDRTAIRQIPDQTAGSGTALFLGGGAESLTALGDLTHQNLRPHLISCLGPGWIGSDPAINEIKVEQDLRISRELGLPLHHIRTNLYGLFGQMQNSLAECMVEDAYFANRTPFTPALVFLFAPLAAVYGLGTAYYSHEMQPENDPCFLCFAKSFTDRLTTVASPKFAFQRVLWDLPKGEVFERLCTSHPRLLKYQYSCSNNRHERWCFACEKCLRYYILCRLFDVPFATVEFDESRMLANFDKLRAKIAAPVWADVYCRFTYGGILEQSRARGKTDLSEFVSNLIRESKRIKRVKNAQAFIRPLVPKPVKRLLKNTLANSPRRRTARA